MEQSYVSSFPHKRDALVPLPSLWPFTGLDSISSCLSWAGELRTGPSIPDMSHYSWVEKDCLPWSAGNTSPGIAQRAVDLCCRVASLSTRTPRLFSAELIFHQSTSRMYWSPKPLLSYGRNWYFLSWVLWGSCQPDSPVCWGPSKGNQKPLLHQLLLQVLCHK